jgi:GNAT superfamily N-acetyltransferase
VQVKGALEEYLAHPTRAIFGAVEPDLIGMAGIAQEEGAKSRHKARLWGVYVIPARRGLGIGRALVEAAIEFARSLDGLTHVHLAVAESGQACRGGVRAGGTGSLRASRSTIWSGRSAPAQPDQSARVAHSTRSPGPARRTRFGLNCGGCSRIPGQVAQGS